MFVKKKTVMDNRDYWKETFRSQAIQLDIFLTHSHLTFTKASMIQNISIALGSH